MTYMTYMGMLNKILNTFLEKKWSKKTLVVVIKPVCSFLTEKGCDKQKRPVPELFCKLLIYMYEQKSKEY